MSNPSLTVQDSRTVLLKWSPPFLWPGQRIDFFNVSLVNRSDGSVTCYRVNTTFNDPVVSLTVDFADRGNSTCTELRFDIVAVSGSGNLPSIFGASLQYQPSE